ncbi:MAG TPA: restriction endonuclease subunit S [Thermoanaerobaculia bacterium]
MADAGTMERAVTNAELGASMLPREWEIVEFDASIQKGRLPVRKIKSSDYMAKGRFPIVDQGQGLIAGYWDDSDGLYDGQEPVIVFGDHTRTFKYIDFPFFAGADGTQILRPNTKIFDPRFLYYALTFLSIPSRGYNRHYSILRQKHLSRPPLSEQRAIAHVLRTVQRAKEATEKVIAAARQLKQSLMRHLFTYGPVPFHEAGQVDIRGTDFGAAPANWTIMRLDECAEVQTGVAKGRKLNSTETVTLPYLRVANVQDGFLDLTEIKTLTIRSSEVDRYSLRRGDVVLTEGGDFDKLGRGFIWTEEVSLCIHQNHIFAVRANRELLLPEFLAYMTQSNYGKAYFLSVAHKTTNLACINTTKLKAFPALLPELEGQRSIIERLRFVDRKIAAEEAKRSSLESLFSSLLHELMTGQTRVD